MWHHDERNYNEAASQAAASGRTKMEEIIHRGQVSAEAVVAQIQNAKVKDKIARADHIRLIAQDDGTFNLATVEPQTAGFSYTQGVDDNPIHPNAFGQLMQTVGVGGEFVNRVQKDAGREQWGTNLIEHCVNEILSHRQKDRHLIRIDEDGGNRVKGFLSDRYRRLDSRPLADAFMGVCTETGLLPIEGVASDTKCRIRAVLPKVFEPIRNEVMIFGLEFGNSDFGDGGMVLNLWTMRMLCTNLAITQKGLRQIHLGGRLPDDLHFSDETYRLDAQTTANALRDVGRQLIGPDPVHRMLDAVTRASEAEIRSADGIDKYLRGLSKGEQGSVRQLFDSPDVVNMPAGDTVYRLSNAVSFFAQNKGVGVDRKLELQEYAGAMIVPDSKAQKVKEV